MSVVHEGWLKKTDRGQKIAGIPIGRSKRKYCILKSNGDFVMMENQPGADDDVYVSPMRHNSSHRGAVGSYSSSDVTSPKEGPSPWARPSDLPVLGSQSFTFPEAVPQLELSLSHCSVDLEVSQTPGPTDNDGPLPTPWEQGCQIMQRFRNNDGKFNLPWEGEFPNQRAFSLSISASENDGDSPGQNGESGSDTDAGRDMSAPRATSLSEEPKPEKSPSINMGRSRSFLDKLTVLVRKPKKKGKTLVIRLDHSVVTGLPNNQISLCVHDFEKIYTLQADSPEGKAAWIEALQRVCAEHVVSLQDFDVVRCLGAGGFGRVYQVRMKHNGRMYAMKVMEKAFLLNKDAVEEVMNEVAILQAFQHPFIARLYCSFQTNDKLCMLMEYLSGGELFTLTQRTLFPEEVTRLYAAQMSLALDYLHKNGIVYRDLKPENVVLDADAHCVLTDFGLAHRFGEERVDAVAGSLTYMAPELLASPPTVTKAVDWWALGCLIFEVTTGRHPFMDEAGEVDVQRVTEAEPQLEPPQGVHVSADLVDVVRCFLLKDHTLRLQDLTTIQAHPWFAGTSWAAVYNREVGPTYRGMPWKPPVAEKYKFDASATGISAEVRHEGPDAAAQHLDGFDWASRDLLCDPALHPKRYMSNGKLRG